MRPQPLEAAEVEAARLSTYPAPYPESWYVVARADEVSTRPMKARVAGQDLVLFRDRAGQARAIDAYCPHMGANLADGVVRDLPRTPAAFARRRAGPSAPSRVRAVLP